MLPQQRPPVTGTVSPSDVLTTLKNLTEAVSSATQSYLNVQGVQTGKAMTVATLLKSGAGRVGTVSVTVTGSTNGFIYDANDVGSTANPIFAIAPSLYVQTVNLPVSFGIVVVPGTGMTVTVSYS